MLTESLLRHVSIGVVAKDILEDDMYVDISPLEIQPAIDGDLTSLTKHSNTVTSPDGNITVVKVDQTNLIKAKWLPDGDTNRLEPPTVCKGELVRLFKYSDTDKWYWSTLYNQLELRKLEKRTIVVSNKKSIDISADQLLANSYFLTMDSINKLVKFFTSDTDGEYTTWEVTFDTEEGIFEITDGKGNQIILTARDDTLETSTNARIINNTTDKTDNIRNHYQINVNTFHVQNGSNELIQTLVDYVQVVHDQLGVGNLGADVGLKGSTKSALKNIQSRLRTFI